MSANSSSVTPLQSLPWKNSIFSLPKKPSARALSGLRPFRHRPHDAVILAYLNPPGPAIVAASVAVPLGVLALLELGACAQKRRVRHLRVRGRGDRPAYRHAVEAVDYRGEVGLSRGGAELRDVRYPDVFDSLEVAG